MDWKRANDLFDIAIQLRDEARDDFLDGACADDMGLRAYVARLLSVDSDPSATSGILPRLKFEVEENTVIDSTVGSYRIERRIGHGGMGGVYLAHRADDAFQKVVAIKILNQGLDADRFRFERQVLAKLEHPNIARLLDGGNIADGRPFVVMEYVAGTHIDQHVADCRLDGYERLALFCELCKGVEHAHKNLIVHRDIKPANVLVSESGSVKLLDFGIAKLVGEDLSLAPAVTNSLARPMTPDYASPEQIFSETITTQSDIYSLGILLYKVLTGVNPNSHVTLRERVEKFANNQSLIPPSQLESDTSAMPGFSTLQCDDLDRILAKATCVSVSGRYESAKDLRLDLENLIHDRPISVRGPNPFYRGRKFFKRNLIATYSVTILALSLLVFGILTVRQNRDLRIERDTTSFLTGVFEEALAGADPIDGDGAVNVQQALADSTARISAGLKNDPHAEFRIRLRVGLLYLGYGNLVAAEAQLLAAERLAARQSVSTTEAIDLNRGLAFLSMADGLYSQADNQVSTAFDLASKIPKAERDPESRLTLLIYQARVHRGLGQIVDAKTGYAEAVDLARQIYGADAIEYGEVVSEYASALIGLGQEQQGRILMQFVSHIDPGTAPNSHSWHYFIKALAAHRLRQRDYDGARALYQEGYDGAVRSYGPQSNLAATMATGIGTAHYRMSDYPAAEQQFRKALQIVESIRPRGAIAVVRKSLNLAQALKSQDRLDDAIALLSHSIAVHRETPAAERNSDVPFYLLVLARIQVLAGRLDDAIVTYEESLKLQRPRPDSADKREEVADAECELAAVLVNAGDESDRPRELFDRCLPALARERGSDSKRYLTALEAANAAGFRTEGP